MNRSKFIKIFSIGAFSFPLATVKSEPKDNSMTDFEKGFRYRRLSGIEKKKFSNDDLDGVILREQNGEYYVYNMPRVDIMEFGAVGDGQTNDYNAIQKAFDSCVKFKKVLYVSRPHQSYISTKSIKIKGQITVIGDGMSECGFNFINSNGFEIQQGVKNVIFEMISINQAVRFSQKGNDFVAFTFLGDDINRPYTNIFRDVFIDGFHTAFKLNWIWDSLFEDVKIVYGNVGFDISGQSVNNVLNNCSVNVEGRESKGVFFNDKSHPKEGWRLTNLFIFGAETAICAFYTSNIYLVTPILDFCSNTAIKLLDGDGPSANWQVLGGYIALSNDAESAVEINTDTNNNQIRGNKFIGVDILGYKGVTIKKAFALMGKYNNSQIKDVSITNTIMLQ